MFLSQVFFRGKHAPPRRTGNPDEAVYGLNHFMGVSGPSGHGIEQVEAEWRELIDKLLVDDDAVLELQVFFKPWDKSWKPSVDEARKALVDEIAAWIEYVFRGACEEMEYHNGVRDRGRPAGTTLQTCLLYTSPSPRDS